MVDKHAPYLRCPICDYQWKPAAGRQSSYFDSLPDEERRKNRYTVKHHRTGEIVLGCADCYGFEVSELNRPTDKELEKLADDLLRQNTAL